MPHRARHRCPSTNPVCDAAVRRQLAPGFNRRWAWYRRPVQTKGARNFDTSIWPSLMLRCAGRRQILERTPQPTSPSIERLRRTRAKAVTFTRKPAIQTPVNSAPLIRNARPLLSPPQRSHLPLSGFMTPREQSDDAQACPPRASMTRSSAPPLRVLQSLRDDDGAFDTRIRHYRQSRSGMLGPVTRTAKSTLAGNILMLDKLFDATRPEDTPGDRQVALSARI